jgi:hypothetical protein
MAHFAEIDLNNIVTRVVVIPNEEEHRGEEFLSVDLGLGGRWIQTSYNNNIRNVYAGIGFTYNEELDIFISPKPFPSWVLNSEGFWEAPIPRPSDPNKVYGWNEEEQKWDITDPIV